jgi:predicted RNA-binding protein with PIN domain
MQTSNLQSLTPLLIIDGFNVLHAGVLMGRNRAEWWKETAQRRLVDRVEQFPHDNEPELWIVFDRRPGKEGQVSDVTSADPRIHIAYAPSADDWIVAQVTDRAEQQTITVVTGDRPLRERVRRVGGRLLSPLQFLAACQ